MLLSFLFTLAIIIILIGAVLIYIGEASNGWWTIGLGLFFLVAAIVIMFLQHLLEYNRPSSDAVNIQGNLQGVPLVPLQ